MRIGQQTHREREREEDSMLLKVVVCLSAVLPYLEAFHVRLDISHTQHTHTLFSLLCTHSLLLSFSPLLLSLYLLNMYIHLRVQFISSVPEIPEDDFPEEKPRSN